MFSSFDLGNAIPALIVIAPLMINTTIANQIVERSKRHKSETNAIQETGRKASGWDNKHGTTGGCRQSTSTGEDVGKRRCEMVEIVRNTAIGKGWGIRLREGLEGYVWGRVRGDHRWHHSVHPSENKESIGVGSGTSPGAQALTVEVIVRGR